jgi:hypothetical protein
LAPVGGRPIAIRWIGTPEEDALEIPPDVDMAASYTGIALEDGRIILAPTAEPLERPDANAQPAAKKVASASKSAGSTSASRGKKSGRAAAPATAKARATAAKGGHAQPAARRTAKASGRQPRKRG